MKNVRVRAGGKEYFVHIGCRLERLGRVVGGRMAGRTVMLVTDGHVEPLYGETVRKSIEAAGVRVFPCVLPPGERVKTFRTVERIVRECSKRRMERGDILIALGGGVCTDLCGFAASIYLRGIRYGSVPTTLLGQVDAAIGGKNGVNLPWGKNLAGTFYQPEFICIDETTISTLPAQEVKQGLAEIVKTGIIGDAVLFRNFERGGAGYFRRNMLAVIGRCVRYKARIVEQDERETTGIRELLNFGHTIGHAVEMGLPGRYSHGEAVALGMVAESWMAFRKGLCREEVVVRTRRLLRRLGLPSSVRTLPVEIILPLLAYDKKVRQGKIRFVLPVRIGAAVPGVVIEPEHIRAWWRELP